MKWESKYLHEIATTSSGGTPSRTVEKYWNGNIPWIKSGQLKDGYITDCDEFITEDGMKNSSASLVLPGTLLLALYGATAGKLAFTSIEATTNQAVCAISTNDKLVNNKYLFYFLLSRRAQILNDAAGGAQPNISQGYVKNIKVPLPPLHIQEQIADTLDKADALRRKDQELLQKYDLLAQSIFYDMFGETTSYKYPKRSLGDALDNIVAGKSLGGEDRLLEGNEYGVLKISSVTSGKFKEEEYKIPDQKELPTKMIYPEAGDLLFSRANTREMVGAVALVTRTNKRLFLPDKLWKLVPKPGFSSYFLKFVLSDPKIREELTKTATGTSGSMLNISMQKLKSLEVPVPPHSLQQEFERRIKSNEEQYELTQGSLIQSKILFKKLSHLYFS